MQSCFCCQPTRETTSICPTCWEAYTEQAFREMRQAIDTVDRFTLASFARQPRMMSLKLYTHEARSQSSQPHHPLDNS